MYPVANYSYIQHAKCSTWETLTLASELVTFVPPLLYLARRAPDALEGVLAYSYLGLLTDGLSEKIQNLAHKALVGLQATQPLAPRLHRYAITPLSVGIEWLSRDPLRLVAIWFPIGFVNGLVKNHYENDFMQECWEYSSVIREELEEIESRKLEAIRPQITKTINQFIKVKEVDVDEGEYDFLMGIRSPLGEISTELLEYIDLKYWKGLDERTTKRLPLDDPSYYRSPEGRFELFDYLLKIKQEHVFDDLIAPMSRVVLEGIKKEKEARGGLIGGLNTLYKQVTGSYEVLADMSFEDVSKLIVRLMIYIHYHKYQTTSEDNREKALIELLSFVEREDIDLKPLFFSNLSIDPLPESLKAYFEDSFNQNQDEIGRDMFDTLIRYIDSKGVDRPDYNELMKDETSIKEFYNQISQYLTAVARSYPQSLENNLVELWLRKLKIEG